MYARVRMQEEFCWFYRAVLAQDDLIRLLAARDYYTAHTPTEEDLLPPSTLRWALKVILTDSIYTFACGPRFHVLRDLQTMHD